ncbi:MAG: alkaline phosphatase family protein [Candidatus Helarchaeota archaeon]
MNHFKRVLYIIIDDVRNDHLHQLMNDGTLPTLQKLSENAADVEHCITTFPSVTVPAHVSLLTGAYVDSFHIPNIKFYQRENAKYVNFADSIQGWMALDEMIPPDVKTIYELFENEDSLVVYEGVSRGATFHYGFQDATNLFRPISKILKKHVQEHENSLPTVSVLWYYQTDPAVHTHGAHSRTYLREIKKVDRDLGKIIDLLKEIRQYDDTLIVITSDHGNYAAREKLDVGQLLQKYGLERDVDFFVDFGSVGLFWFTTGPDPSRPLRLAELRKNGSNSIDLIKIIGSLKGIERLFYYDEKTGLIHGFFDGKEGTIAWKNGKTSIAGDDIFEYSEDSLASGIKKGIFYDSDEWLKYTYKSKLPLLPDHLARLFHNRNRPDIIACTDRKTVYHHLYSHDTYTQESMNVPLLLAGSKMVPKKLKHARTVDVLPTILHLLGRDVPANMIGKPLL